MESYKIIVNQTAKTYVIKPFGIRWKSSGGGGGTWGTITGDIQEQDDLIELFNDKVDKEPGKGLSENDYTTVEKEKLAGIEDGAQKNALNTVIDANYVHTDENFTATLKDKLDGIEPEATKGDSDAFHKSTPYEISTLEPKGNLVDDDIFLIEDSEDNFNKKNVLLGKIKSLFAKLTGGNIFSGVQSMLDGIKVTKLYPNADGIAAIQIMKADGTTALFYFDTTNGRFGIGGSPLTKLHIIDTASGNNYMRFDNSAVNAFWGVVGGGISAGGGSLTNHDVLFYRGGTEIFRINASALQISSALALDSNKVRAQSNNDILITTTTSGRLINIDRGINQLITLPFYQAASPTADTVGDTKRTTNSSGFVIEEVCTVANATKGSGTWRIKSISQAIKALTNNTSANLLDINCAVDTMQLVSFEYGISYKDTTNHQVRSHYGQISFNVRNQNGVITTNIVHPATLENDLGSITDTWTLTAGTNKATVSLVANASVMTPTSGIIYFDVKSFGNNNITLL